jgi:hypothetical protein
MLKRLGGGLHVFLVVFCLCVLGTFIVAFTSPVPQSPATPEKVTLVKPVTPKVVYHQTFTNMLDANTCVGEFAQKGCAQITVTGGEDNGYGYWIVIGYKY